MNALIGGLVRWSGGKGDVNVLQQTWVTLAFWWIHVRARLCRCPLQKEPPRRRNCWAGRWWGTGPTSLGLGKWAHLPPPLASPTVRCWRMEISPPPVSSLPGTLTGKACLCGRPTAGASCTWSWIWMWAWDRNWRSRRWSFGQIPSPWSCPLPQPSLGLLPPYSPFLCSCLSSSPLLLKKFCDFGFPSFAICPTIISSIFVFSYFVESTAFTDVLWTWGWFLGDFVSISNNAACLGTLPDLFNKSAGGPAYWLTS